MNIGCVLAADDKGTLFDLKWAFLNFFVLSTFIIWRIKKPLAEMFGKNFSDMKYLYNVAQEKDKESSIKYEIYKKKVEGMDREHDAVLEEFRGRGSDFVREYKKEGDLFIEKLRQEKDRKIEVEKKKILKEMENIVIANIILKAKRKIGSDQELKSQVSKGLLAKIG